MSIFKQIQEEVRKKIIDNPWKEEGNICTVLVLHPRDLQLLTEEFQERLQLLFLSQNLENGRIKTINVFNEKLEVFRSLDIEQGKIIVK